MAKLILYAPNVHAGGGKILLLGLLKVLEGFDCYLILDQRLNYYPARNNVLAKVSPTFISRLRAEISLKNNSNQGDLILCFHSIPPLFKSKARVIVYFHNKHIIGSIKLMLNEGFRAIFRLTIERILSRIFYKNVDQYLVQSESMKRDLDFYYSNKMSLVSVCPFSDSICIESFQKSDPSEEFEFIYPSVGLKHKNHLNLLKAWVLLAENGIFPNLIVTLSGDNVDIIKEMNRLIKKYNLQIKNLGWIEAKDLYKVYSGSKVLIFPSLMESFGLPLLEAKKLGLPILASELDYVRDVCNPDESFDPKSYVSIARAIMRFLKLQKIEDSILTSEEFVDKLYDGL